MNEVVGLIVDTEQQKRWTKRLLEVGGEGIDKDFTEFSANGAPS
jgi:hypothetical protein